MNPRLLLFVGIVLALVAGGVFLATRTIPAPHHITEKVIANDRFLK